MNLVLFLFCFLDSTYKRNQMYYSFFVWLISLITLPSRSSLSQMTKLHSFLQLINTSVCVFMYLYISQSLYLFIHWWTLRLFHTLATVMQQWIRVCIHLFKAVLLFSSKVELLDHMVVHFSFFEESPYCFPRWLHQVTFPPKVHKASLFCRSLPTLHSLYFFDDSHSNKCEVVFHCGLDLHFSDDLWYWVSFHVPVGHWHVFLGKIAIQIFSVFNLIVWGLFAI